jgi:RNA polymerase sigma-70 factor (ECF subfamily)
MDERTPATAGSPPGARSGNGPPPAPTPELVFREYAPRIYNLARRMLGSDSDAEDVTQDVLVQVIRNLGSFRGESALSTWLHRITVNAALAHRHKRAVREGHHRREPVETFVEDDHRDAPVRRWSVGPEEQALNRETQRLIEEAITRLPETYRDVFVLADVEGLPNAETGELLGLSVAAVKSRLHRARLLMRKALAPHFEEVSA